MITMTGTAKKAISLTVIAIILAALIAGNVVASMFAGIITNFFSANSTDFSGEETQQALQQSDELVRTLAEDSIVLLKNQEDSDGEPALPLTEDELKVNLFGFSAYDPSSAASFDGFLMKGIGSGSSTISQNKAITLQGALEENGIEYNTDLEAIYDNFNVGRGGNSGNAYWLDEPEITEEQFQQAEEYSDVAIVVFSRLGGENIGEQPHQQTQGAVNPDKTYLEITDPEQELLDEVTARFDKVIVLLNTSNAMHCGFLDDEYVDAAMYVGLTGQSAPSPSARSSRAKRRTASPSAPPASSPTSIRMTRPTIPHTTTPRVRRVATWAPISSSRRACTTGTDGTRPRMRRATLRRRASPTKIRCSSPSVSASLTRRLNGRS